MQTAQNPLITGLSQPLDSAETPGFWYSDKVSKGEKEVKLEHRVYTKGIRLSCLSLFH